MWLTGAGRMQSEAGDRAIKPGVAVVEDAAVRGVEPVAPTIGCGHDANDGTLQREAPR